MIHKAVGKLLIVAGLVSLMVIGLALPLRAAPVAGGLSFRKSATTGTGTNTLPTIFQSPPSTTAETITPAAPSTSTTGGLIKDRFCVLTGALIFLLLLLGVLLIIRALRGRGTTESPPRPTAPTGPHLESTDASGAQRRLNLPTTDLTIGRAPESDLVITQDFPGWETVSGHHARLYQEERQGNHWIVEDLDSTNGVYVNGKRTGHNLLRDGWQLDIGGVSFVFRTGGERGEA